MLHNLRFFSSKCRLFHNNIIFKPKELYRRKDGPLPPPINPFWRASVDMCIVLLLTIYLTSLLVSLTVRWLRSVNNEVERKLT